MEFDTIYKFVAASFAIAYFVGLVIGITATSFGFREINETEFSKDFYLTGQINLKQNFDNTLFSSLKLMIFPFSYIIPAINFGLSHGTHLLSPFLGQIKLAVLLIPNFFHFLAFILFSTIGLKLIASLVLFIVNKILKKKKIKKIKLLQKRDILFFYFGVLAIVIGSLIQIFLSKVFFIFLINYQIITYILIIIIYGGIIFLSFMILYKTILSLVKLFKSDTL